MRNVWKKSLSVILAIVMIVGMLPSNLFAIKAKAATTITDTDDNGWEWKDSNKTTLYVKADTAIDLYDAIVDKHGTGGSGVRYKTGSDFKYTLSYMNDSDAKDIADNGSVKPSRGTIYYAVLQSGKTRWNKSYITSGSFSVEYWYEPTVNITSEDGLDVAGVTVSGLPSTFVHGEDVIFKLSGVTEEGWVATIGEASYTLSTAGETEVKAVGQTSAAINVEISKAATYSISVVVANENGATGNWGTASVDVGKGIANAQIPLTIIPAADTDSAKYTYEVSVNEHGSYADGKVTIKGTGDVVVTVTFSKRELSIDDEKEQPIEVTYNWFDGLTTAQQMANTILGDGVNRVYADVANKYYLEQAIFEALGVGHFPASIEWNTTGVTYEYYAEAAYEDYGLFGDWFNLDAVEPKFEADILGLFTVPLTVPEFAAGGEDSVVEVRISYGDLSVTAKIKLVEGRQVVTITNPGVADVTVTNSEDPILAAVQAATTISSGNVTVTPVWEKVSGTLPTATTNTTEVFKYKVTVAETAENQAAELEITGNAVLKQYTISWDTDDDGDVDETTQVYYNVLPVAPAAVEKDGYSVEWPTLSVATADVTYTVNYSEDDIYTITFVTNIEGYNIASQTYNVTKNPEVTVTAPSVEDQPYKIFDGWFTDAEFKNAYTFGSTPDASITLYAKWVYDTHDNDVRDENETVTIVIGGNGSGTVTIDGTIVSNDDSYIYDSTKPNTITVTPGDWSGKGEYVKSCSVTGGTFSSGIYTVSVELTNGAQINVEFGTRALNASESPAASINGHNKDTILNGLKNKLIYAVLGNVDNISQYTVEIWVDLGVWKGWVNPEDASVLNTVSDILNRFGLAFWLEVPGSEQVKITWAGDNQLPEVVWEGNVKIEESRKPAQVSLGAFSDLSN